MHPHFRVIPFLCRICEVSECGYEALVLDGLRGHLPYPCLAACVGNKFTQVDNNLLLDLNWLAMDEVPIGAGKRKVSFREHAAFSVPGDTPLGARGEFRGAVHC